MKNNYHERRANRIQNALDQSAKREKEATQSYQQARAMGNVMQGEPVKRGHHSEKRHRRDIDKMDNQMRKSVEASRKADYYAGKAETIESNTSISSDNPDALPLLREKLDKLKKKQEWMKAVNKCVRAGDKDGFMKLPGSTDSRWEMANDERKFGGKGIPSFELTNNNANIRRIRQRIEELEKAATRETAELNMKGVRVVQNVDANRVQLFFPAKPVEEVRGKLRKAGFHWSGSERAWQRQLTDNAIYAAKEFLSTFDETTAYKK